MPDIKLTKPTVPQALYGQLLSRKELAVHLNVSHRYVSKLMARNAIPLIRMGPQLVRFDLGRVREALDKLEVKAA